MRPSLILLCLVVSNCLFLLFSLLFDYLFILIVESIAVDPTNVNVVYAAFGNSKSDITGVYPQLGIWLSSFVFFVLFSFLFHFFVLFFFFVSLILRRYASTNQGNTWTKTGLSGIAVLGNADYR